MTRRLYLLANEQNVVSLLELASNGMEHDNCHMFLRYNWHDSDLTQEVDFSKSFACLVDVTRNCGFMNLTNVFKSCRFAPEVSRETGFITFRKGNEFSFAFAFLLDEGNKQIHNLLRISGKVEKSISATDSDLLGYLLALGI